MKHLLFFVLFLGSAVAFAQNKTTPNQPTIKFKNSTDSFSYAAGISMANYLKEQGMEKINVSLLKKAIDDVYGNKDPQLSLEQCGSLFQTGMQKASQEKNEKKAAVEKKKGSVFLANNAKRAGVVSLPNGMQYEVLTSGDPNGMRPTPSDTVEVHYVGTLIDGTEFDNSVKRGEKAKFPLNQVIKGWTEILQLMTPGDKWKVYIPYDLAYGERGAGGAIPGYATLIFEITLYDIMPSVKE